MRLLTAALLTSLLVSLPPAARAEVFDAESFTLDNGLEVVVITNRLAPVVTHMIWYRAGAADEPPGQSGIAHYAEHLMFLGTDAYPEGQITQLVQRNGGVQNAFTSWDYTAYHQSIAVDRLPLMMALEADRMAGITVSEARAATELDVVLQERLQRIDNAPSGRFGEQLMASLYQHHPYGTPIIGWEHEVATLTLADAEAFLDTWYVPNNAYVVVAGDIDAETLRPLAEDAYGHLPRGPDLVRDRVDEPAQFGARQLTMTHDQVQQAEWMRLYLAPGYMNADDPVTPYALQVLSEMLGGSLSSGLYRTFVVEQGLAAGAGAFYSAGTIGDSQFGLYAVPHPDISLAEIGAAMDAEVERLLRDGAAEDEVAAAVDRLQIAAVYSQDSVGGAARIVGRALAIGQTLDDIQAWPARIGAVTAEDVTAAAHLVFRPEQSVTGWLMPADAPQDFAGGSQ